MTEHTVGRAENINNADSYDIARPPHLKFNVAVAFVAALAAEIFYNQFYLTHDASWYLIATRQFLDGAELYVDVVELNPPLAFYLTIPALFISDITWLSDTQAYVLYFAFLAFMAIVWVAALVDRSSLTLSQRWTMKIGAIAITLVLPISDFGQREQLMLILTLPYFVFLIFHDEIGKLTLPERLFLGAFAVLGFALKPHFYLAPALLNLVILYRTRSFAAVLTPANITIATGTVLYGLFVWLAHPAYFQHVVPMARTVYGSYGVAGIRVFFRPAFSAAIATAIALIALRRRLGTTEANLISISFGFLICYLIQFKGWNYHLLPASAYLMLTIIWLSTNHLHALQRHLTIALLLVFGMSGTLGYQLSRGPYSNELASSFQPFITTNDVPVLVLSSNVYAAFPFVNQVNAEWTSRYPTQWLIPGAYSASQDAGCPAITAECANLQRILIHARTTIIDDLIAHPPDLVFIDEREEKSHFRGVVFDYLDFLEDDERFPEIWTTYAPLGTTNNYSAWERIPTDQEAHR